MNNSTEKPAAQRIAEAARAFNEALAIAAKNAGERLARFAAAYGEHQQSDR